MCGSGEADSHILELLKTVWFTASFKIKILEQQTARKLSSGLLNVNIVSRVLSADLIESGNFARQLDH